MAIGKTTTILAGTAIAGLGVATLAPTATAETSTTWIQQVQRASADAPCDIPAVEGEMAGWSDWGPSWAQWPHDGQGGWVCTRSITWAHSPGSGGSNSGGSDSSTSCITGFDGTVFWDFTGTDWLPVGTQLYADSACTTPREDAPVVSTGVTVLADSEEAADAICEARDPGTSAGPVGIGADPRLYYCNSG